MLLLPSRRETLFSRKAKLLEESDRHKEKDNRESAGNAQPPFTMNSQNRSQTEANTLDGSRYFVTFIDDYSRHIFVYFLKSKGDVFRKFKVFKQIVEKQTGHKIKMIRSDKGREFINKYFKIFLESEGITRQFTLPYTPQQNGVAERVNHTLIEMARAMMVHANVQRNLWAEAISTAAYLIVIDVQRKSCVTVHHMTLGTTASQMCSI